MPKLLPMLQMIGPGDRHRRVLLTREELLALIAEVRQHQSELEGVEVKSAHRGTPRRLFEVLSAFANRTGGGVIIFGLDEERDFQTVGVGDAHKLQEDMSSLVSSLMEPALQPEFTVEEIDGKTVVAAEVTELPPSPRPCYYRTAGLQGGSYIRVGNTNRRMSDYEIFGYVSAREQPTFDEEPVGRATLDDLDRRALDDYVAGLRRARPDAAFLDRPLEEALEQLRIVRNTEGVLRPTLVGLLVFGTYPQTYEPQLVITFVQYYGVTEEEQTPRGERFLDNRKFEGPVLKMVDNAVNHVMATIRKSSLIEGLLRRDIPEYPEGAVREAVVNAVAHRDYSNFVRGSYVQIRLFADRLEIQSPGGLYGNVTEDTIEEEQSTRNRTLMRLMEDLHIVENRGSGISTMIRAMRHANLEPPRFRDRRNSFRLTLHSHTLMSPEAVSWLNQFADRSLNDRHRLALAYLRKNSRITNGDYRRLNHVDALTAGQELRDLVQQGLATQHGSRRWTYYTLGVPVEAEPARVEAAPSDEERILEYVREHGSINNAQCRGFLGVDANRAWYLLSGLVEAGKLRREGERRWTRYVLPG